MRKLIFLFVLVSLVLPCAFAQNTVSRVTYFPISYVAYHNLNAGQMDIGLRKSDDFSPSVSLGKTGESAIPLNVTGTGTKVNSGAELNLKGTSVKVTGDDSEATVGDGNGTASLKFSNLKIGNATTMTSLNTNTMSVSNLTLFGKTFPSCNGSGARFNDSEEGEMQWVQLKFQSDKSCAWYLACGDAPKDAELCELHQKKEHDPDTDFSVAWVATIDDYDISLYNNPGAHLQYWQYCITPAGELTFKDEDHLLPCQATYPANTFSTNGLETGYCVPPEIGKPSALGKTCGYYVCSEGDVKKMFHVTCTEVPKNE